MEYLIKEEDMLGLKMEDNSDQYLFNSLLDIGQLEQQHIDHEEPQHYSFVGLNSNSHEKSKGDNFQETILHELCHIYNIRTTPLSELMAYAEQAYEPSDIIKKSLFATIKRVKLQLKRENAKKRVPQPERSEEIIEEVKIEDNQLSSFVFDDQSQETKKKKRNRMSAQKSRDRKKEYIK